MLVLLALQSGQMIALPVVVYIFGFLNILQSGELQILHLSSLCHMMFSVSRLELMWVLEIGIQVSVGYACYYYGASGAIPDAVAFALMMSTTLFSAMLNIFVFQEYSQVNLISITTLAVIISFGFYASAIAVFLEYAFIA